MRIPSKVKTALPFERLRFLPRICAFALAASLLLAILPQLLAQTAELAAISSLIQQGKLADADQKLQAYLRVHPHSAKANILLGTVYGKQGNAQKAILALRNAVAAAPSDEEARLTLGDAYLADGKFDLALAAYQAGAKLAPRDTRFNLALAKLYLGSGEFAQSLQAAEGIPPAKRSAELLPTLAADYFGLQQPDKAALEIQAMLQVSEKQPDLVPELAEFFLSHHDFKSAGELLALAKSKRRPATDRFQIDFAQTQAGLGQLDDAQTTLEGVLERKPDSVEALVAAGQVAGKQGNWDAAAEAFSRADGLSPGRPDILYGLINAQLRANQPEPAEKNAARLRVIAPDDLRASYVSALSSFGVRKKEEAKKFAQQVLAVHPDDREMNLVLTDIALNDDHDLGTARTYVNACLKANPGDLSAIYYQGMILKMEGDLSGAIQNLKKTAEGNPQNSNAQAALGSLCLQTDNMACAVPALEQAARLAPSEAHNHYQLALAYTRAGNADKAKEQLAIYQQMKAKEAKDAKGTKGPATSEVPPMGIGSRP